MSAPSQSKVFRYLWAHPNAPLVLVAKETHLSYIAARVAKHNLSRRKDLARLCPECFQPTLEGLVCRTCGVELDQPEALESDGSPVHSIQPLNGLGSQTSYLALRFSYGGQNIAHLVERASNSFLERCKSLLWGELKGPMLPDGTVEEANRLLVKEVIDFRARYPMLAKSKRAAEQIVENVMGKVRLRYPAYFEPLTPKQEASA